MEMNKGSGLFPAGPPGKIKTLLLAVPGRTGLNVAVFGCPVGWTGRHKEEGDR